MGLPRLALGLGGLGFLAFGAMFMVAPLQTMAMAGIELQGGLAATELRAFYGGLELALAALLLRAALRPQLHAEGLLLMAFAYGGIGTARFIGIALEGSATPFLWFALGTEWGLAALAGWARSRLRRG
ncbi:DUF4345 family protein [Pseudomarimonas arenosa]|uniref:DUF4345 family protein n=1 Tax=Pseudomarimonas arenosa TaxID=2774145 RepID=A0AAW3ZKL9_9GAMM|nr:DUF4345 family protein [Pseudomarimonas arenosa]MBD8525602.1 DUF4345 family protein [Pseudomarimonas arenosa]